MDHVIGTVHCHPETSLVADIADEEPENIVVFSVIVVHDELLVFVPAVDDDFLWFIVLKYVVHEMVPEGTRAAGDEYGFVV